ncbi:unnamed protein product [Ectocarpus sp. 12 AP-2014]
MGPGKPTRSDLPTDAPQALSLQKNGSSVCRSDLPTMRRRRSNGALLSSSGILCTLAALRQLLVCWLALSQLLGTNSATTTDKSIRLHREGRLTGRKPKKRYINRVYCQLRAARLGLKQMKSTTCNPFRRKRLAL